jgi:hypothetical protein
VREIERDSHIVTGVKGNETNKLRKMERIENRTIKRIWARFFRGESLDGSDMERLRQKDEKNHFSS